MRNPPGGQPATAQSGHAVTARVAAALMLTGIALVGVVTAALASWFVEKVAEVEAAEESPVPGLAELASEVSALRRELAVHRQGSWTRPSTQRP